jgi:hypothetical protein
MFAGLVKCSSCGSSLNVSYDAKKGRFTGFSCWVYKNYGKERCTSHAIGWKTLNTLVLDDVRRNAYAAANATELYYQLLLAARDVKRCRETEKLRKEVKRADRRIDELDRIIQKLFEQSALGKIPEQRAQSMMAAYEQEQSELTTKRDSLQAEISKAEEASDNALTFLNLIKKYTHIEELNTAILNELIEKIVVHEKQETEDGRKLQTVEIHYRFIGYVAPEMLFDGIDRVNGFPLEELLMETLEERGQNLLTAQAG